ncbi:bifunctional serine/threonine-protein kinase/ABC transporter substrate-binding protein [Streptomyces oceani]|uniref:Protein kinase domain-containing protein n=1 Tax=Streptomyces oceani TaxID=1075402 RepID=A0A1E7KQ36_9ACTN|nr:bifunctional serine/threonine-protein kinase/ABC transporter substrate-binding protein [Streptomyces oceani]OEV06038.1 hypothetical protein AN216_00775 [Streptomyces oceani]
MTEPLRPSDPARLGEYRLLGRLGAGGMGVVYLGRTTEGALAALKVIHAEHTDDPDFRARFRREVDLARRVSSPWAVPVTAAAPDAAEPWLATAFVPGPSLADAVGRHGPLPVHSVRALAGMLAGALEAVHAAGLAHRDVKPANVLLALDGPRLIDFGIARATDETALTAPERVIGTPGYLSPEQALARGGQVGAASDVFSLGCLLAYALLGRPPFGTGTSPVLLFRTVHEEPDLDGLPDDSADLRRLLLSCLAKDPADRPAAERIRAELVGASDGDTALDGDTTPEGDTAAEVGAAPEGDAPEGDAADWLPEAIVRSIADHADELLALPDIEPTAAGHSARARELANEETAAPPPTGDGDQASAGDDQAPTEHGTGPARPTRRRLLALSGGALLAAGAGAGAWTVLRDGSGTGGEPRWAIGVQADLSGEGKAVGRAQERGARLAVEQYNAGEDRPFELALRTADDGGDPERAPGAARRLTEDTGVLAALGPSSEATALAVADTYDEAWLAMLPVSAGGIALGAKGSRSVVLCRPDNATLSAPLAAHLINQAARNGEKGLPGLLQDRTAETYAWECATITSQNLRSARMPAYPRVVPADLKDLEPVVTDMLGAGIDSLVYAGEAAGAVRVARALAAAGFEGPRLGPPALTEPRFRERAGEAAEGWLVTASFVDVAETPKAADFRTAFRERFGVAAPPYAAEAYDAAKLVLREIKNAAKPGGAKDGSPRETPSEESQDGQPRPPKRGELVKRLRKSTYEGVTKKYVFDPETGSFQGTGGVFLYEVTEGSLRFRGDAPTVG